MASCQCWLVSPRVEHEYSGAKRGTVITPPTLAGTLPLAPLPGQICNVRGECALELETKIRADFTITEKSHIHISLP